MVENKRVKLGFVVNIANPLNLDVDFGLSDDELKYYKLQNVEYVNYSYIDDDDGDLSTGKAYRTRMEGVTTKKEFNGKKNMKLQSRLLYEIVRFLDRTGGFVKYKITGVDIFRRAIVKLFDPVSGESINELILDQKYSSIYCNYNRIINEEPGLETKLEQNPEKKDHINKNSNKIENGSDQYIKNKKNTWRLSEPK